VLRQTLAVAVVLMALSSGGLARAQNHAGESSPASAHIPALPFDDNPDPTLCGIPEPWGSDESAWLSGYYEGELIQPVVFLYDSHLRREITGEAPTGTEVKILLFQNNPSLNYYLVKTVGDNPQEGWVPEPFLMLEPTD
jgi:hypothetical protein